MSRSLPLCEALAVLLAEPLRAGFAPTAERERNLRDALDHARSTWPDVHLADVAVLTHFARALARGRAASVDAWIARGTMADLYLACGCAAGDPAAISAFDACHLAAAEVALRRLRFAPELIAEVKQHVRVAVLVGDGARPPRIAEFTGAGNLSGWLRVVAINAARRLLRDRGREPTEAAISPELVPAVGQSAELAWLKDTYRAQFRVAFEGALAALPRRDRALLRQHYVLGLTIDEIGTMHGIHRATSARQLARCRDRLYSDTRRRLVTLLGVDRFEIDSIMRLISSQLDVSLRASLGAAP